MHQWLTAMNPGKHHVSWDDLVGWGRLGLVDGASFRRLIYNEKGNQGWVVTGWVMPVQHVLERIPLRWPSCWNGLRGKISGFENVYLCLNLTGANLNGVQVEFGKFLEPKLYHEAVTSFLNEQIARINQAVSQIPGRYAQTDPLLTPYHVLLDLLFSNPTLSGSVRLAFLKGNMRPRFCQQVKDCMNLDLEKHEPLLHDAMNISGEDSRLFPNYDFVYEQMNLPVGTGEEAVSAENSGKNFPHNLLLLRFMEALAQQFRAPSGSQATPAYNVKALDTFLQRCYDQFPGNEPGFLAHLWNTAKNEWLKYAPQYQVTKVS